jgi:hypothetical protein
MKPKLSIKLVVEVEYELNDETVSHLTEVIDKKINLCMRAIVYPPAIANNKTQAKIKNFNYSILTEEI